MKECVNVKEEARMHKYQADASFHTKQLEENAP